MKKLLGVLLIAIALQAGGYRPCCSQWASNAAAGFCKYQGGCSDSEYDEVYDEAYNQCLDNGLCSSLPMAHPARVSIFHRIGRLFHR